MLAGFSPLLLLKVTPADNQRTLIEELEFLPDPFERLNTLVARSAKLVALPKDQCCEEFLVHGCQSELWIAPQRDAQSDVWTFQPWSEAPMVAALGQLFCSIYSGCKGEAIRDFEATILDDLNLNRSLTPNRQHGARQIVAKIRGYVQASAAAP